MAEFTKEFYGKPILLKDVDSKTVIDLKVSKVSELTISKVSAMIVMSHADFIAGGKYIKGVPVAITPDGLPPKIIDEAVEFVEPIKEEPILKEPIIEEPIIEEPIKK